MLLSAVIVGDDADLVLMACVSWMDNLYVANSYKFWPFCIIMSVLYLQ